MCINFRLQKPQDKYSVMTVKSRTASLPQSKFYQLYKAKAYNITPTINLFNAKVVFHAFTLLS